MADRIIVVLRIAVRLGVCVVRQELQSIREALIQFDLKCVIGTGRIVPVVVTQIERNPRVQWPPLILRSECAEGCTRCATGTYWRRRIWHRSSWTRLTCARPTCDTGIRNRGALPHRCGVDVIVRSVAGKPVRSLAADVSDLQRHRVRELVLNRDVPCVHSGQSLPDGTNMGTGEL